MIKKRIIQVLEYKLIKKEDFYKKIGVTSANFRGKASETPLNSNTIENILTVIPDLNLYWLITGEGEMLQHKGHEEVLIENRDEEFVSTQRDLIKALKYQITCLETEVRKLKKEKPNEVDYLHVAEPNDKLKKEPKNK